MAHQRVKTGSEHMVIGNSELVLTTKCSSPKQRYCQKDESYLCFSSLLFYLFIDNGLLKMEIWKAMRVLDLQMMNDLEFGKWNCGLVTFWLS
jgi:hypothetical protein